MNAPRPYQLDAIRALQKEGFDRTAILTIVRIVQRQGRRGLDHYLTQFLSACEGASVTEISSWIPHNDTTVLLHSPSVKHVKENSLSSLVLDNVEWDAAHTEFCEVSNKRKRTKGNQTSTTTSNPANGVRATQFFVEHCRLLGCNKPYIHEKRFVSNFLKCHPQLPHDRLHCCGQNHQSQGIEGYAQHIWRHHRMEYQTGSVGLLTPTMDLLCAGAFSNATSATPESSGTETMTAPIRTIHTLEKVDPSGSDISLQEPDTSWFLNMDHVNDAGPTEQVPATDATRQAAPIDFQPFWNEETSTFHDT